MLCKSTHDNILWDHSKDEFIIDLGSCKILMQEKVTRAWENNIPIKMTPLRMVLWHWDPSNSTSKEVLRSRDKDLCQDFSPVL
jgi:hypothetical protein